MIILSGLLHRHGSRSHHDLWQFKRVIRDFTLAERDEALRDAAHEVVSHASTEPNLSHLAAFPCSGKRALALPCSNKLFSEKPQIVLDGRNSVLHIQSISKGATDMTQQQLAKIDRFLLWAQDQEQQIIRRAGGNRPKWSLPCEIHKAFDRDDYAAIETLMSEVEWTDQEQRT